MGRHTAPGEPQNEPERVDLSGWLETREKPARHRIEMAIEPECAAAWPGAWSMEYDPRCCRFPKSCSATIPPPYPADEFRDSDRHEPAPGGVRVR